MPVYALLIEECGILQDLSASKAFPAVKLIAKNGAARESYLDNVKSFDEIEMIVKKEPGICIVLDRMSKEDDGDQHSSKIEIVDEKFVDIDGIKVSRRSFRLIRNDGRVKVS